jgi:hypothetical protein
VALLALVLALVMASAAMADEQAFPSIKVSGELGFAQNGMRAHAEFEAEAVGPAAPGQEHQPAVGVLKYSDSSGLRFRVLVDHIHAMSANEVHFGGMIVAASDPSLVGKHAHMVAIDNGRRGDRFSLLVTSTDTHEHAVPVTVGSGGLVVSTR